jgi:hypothetical protein
LALERLWQAFQRQKRAQEAAKAAAVREEKAKQAARRKAAQVALQVPLVQRKIFHLFAFTGQGDTFWYRSQGEAEFGLNDDQVAFDPRSPAVLTLKWDGTTVQATRDAVWRRQDMRWSKSGPRYVLILVCWYENGEWIGIDDSDVDPNMAACVREFLPTFRRLPPGVCVYFEACSPAINATFKQAEMTPTVRVFDSSEGGRFRPFEATIQLADEIGLPHVGVFATLPECSSDAAWAELQRARTLGYPGFPNSALEGFVARQGDAIAKARVEYCNS